jgi:hypothetical protein
MDTYNDPDLYATLQQHPLNLIDMMTELLGQNRTPDPKPHKPSDIPEWMQGQQMELD